MGELAEAGAVAFSDDGVPVASAGLMRRALQYASSTDRPLALHCEEPTLSRGGHVHEGRVAAELGFAGYPSVAESVMVARDLSLARFEGQRVHLLHLSARESVELLASARAEGARASGEVTPHHLVLTDEAVRSLDPNLKMNPPVREDADRSALLEALRNGNIQCVASDHAPHARHEKEAPFEEAPFGVTGLETAFAVLYGESVGAEGTAYGEAVFTTSMSGYQETVTDPSYAGQIVCFTAPMVGNYGVADERSQSDRVHATAVVMREARGPDWTEWLRE